MHKQFHFQRYRSTYSADLSSISLKRGANRVKIVARPAAQDAKFIAANTFVCFFARFLESNFIVCMQIALAVATPVSLVDIELTRDGSFGKKSWAFVESVLLLYSVDVGALE